MLRVTGAVEFTVEPGEFVVSVGCEQGPGLLQDLAQPPRQRNPAIGCRKPGGRALQDGAHVIDLGQVIQTEGIEPQAVLGHFQDVLPHQPPRGLQVFPGNPLVLHVWREYGNPSATTSLPARAGLSCFPARSGGSTAERP